VTTSPPVSTGCLLCAATNSEVSSSMYTHFVQAVRVPTRTCPTKGLKTTSLKQALKYAAPSLGYT
jgi:hypothetical protein